MKQKHSNLKIYAFIDSQNLNLSIRNNITTTKGKKIYQGWNLDFKKFRVFLKEKYHVEKAFLFIGMIEGNEELYKNLEDAGYILIQKPTLTRKVGEDSITKGNVDAELVLHASAIEFENYDKAVIVSGDGDFRCLYEFLIEKEKLLKIIIPNKISYSSLLRGFSNYFDFLSNKKNMLSLNKKHDKKAKKDANKDQGKSSKQK